MKMYWKVEIEFSIKAKNSKILKALTYKTFQSFWAYPKKVVEFTGLTHKIYRPAKTEDKKYNLDNLSIYVSTKYIPNNVWVSSGFPNVMHNI